MMTVDRSDIYRTSYNSSGLYKKQTTHADGAHSLECGTDGVNWGACQ